MRDSQADPDQNFLAVKPFLRWAGSKRQLIPKLASYWTGDYSRYVEPFAGSASLFFHIGPPSALLADINVELIHTYNQVKTNNVAVISDLRTLRKGKQRYLSLRATAPLTLSPSMRAARFIYLNRYCFNGLYRTNQKGIFNVPYSGSKTGGLPIGLLTKCSILLKEASLVASNFEEVLAQVRPGDFVYMDPPFSVKGVRTFSEYDAATFSHDQLRILRQWLLHLDRLGVTFLVSYADSNEGEDLGAGFQIERVMVRRNIAGFAANRRHATEMLIYNARPRAIGARK